MIDQPTTTTPALVFSITPESVTALLTFLKQGQSVAVAELSQIQPIVFDPEKLPELQKTKAEYVEKLSKTKMVYEKMLGKRKAFTNPIKDKIQEIMQFENALDPTKEDNEYAKARKVIENFDNAVLKYTKAEEEKAEVQKRVNKYKADVRAGVEKRLLEMMTGQEKGITSGMINWESGITLENIVEKETSLKAAPLVLNKPKYDACFTTDFPGKNPHLMAENILLEFVIALKSEFTYEKYNEQYLQMAAPIKNEYLAKIPDLKVKLEQIKNDAAAQETRKKELEDKNIKAMEAINQNAAAKNEEISQRQEMDHYQSDFIEQGITAKLPQQASKKVASFENEALWLQPLLQVIAHVAVKGKLKVKNAKGEFVPEIQKWLTAFESCHEGKDIPGIVLTDEARTVIRK